MQMDGGEEAKPVVKAEGDANVLSIKVKDQSGGEVRTGGAWNCALVLSLHAAASGAPRERPDQPWKFSSPHFLGSCPGRWCSR